MSRAALISLLALTAIFCAVIFSGCSSEPQDVNNTTSNDTLQAFGYVLLGNDSIAGARVVAVSLDGSHVVTTQTTASGIYALNLTPEVWYRVTASFDGLSHTISPVYLPRDSTGNDRYDIILTRTHRSAISGTATADSPWAGEDVHVQAIPGNGSYGFITATGADGSYSLDLVPGEYYYVSAYTNYSNALVYYRNTVTSSLIKPAPDETLLVDYKARMSSSDTVPATPTPIVQVTPTSLPDGQPTVAPGRARASGHVYLDGRPVNVARVEAVSFDGIDHLSTVTNVSGAYALDIVCGVKYNISANYGGLKHTITPVYLNEPGIYNSGVADQYDINLSRKPSSTLKGLISPGGFWEESMSTVVIAAGYDGVWQASGIISGSYTLDLKPGVFYTLTGNCTDPYGQSGNLQFVYRNDNYCTNFTMGQDETILVDTRVSFFHPPKSLFWTIENTSEFPRFLPPTVVSISGHVYFDGKPVSHASVRVITGAEDANVPDILNAQAFTDDRGAYNLSIASKTLYKLVATYQGRECIVKQVFLKDNMTDVYDINIMSMPRQGVEGVLISGWGSETLTGKITIRAVPVYGGAAVNKTFNAGEGFFLDLAPGLYYNITGTFRDAAGQERPVYLRSRLGGSCQRILVRPDETIPADYYYR